MGASSSLESIMKDSATANTFEAIDEDTGKVVEFLYKSPVSRKGKRDCLMKVSGFVKDCYGEYCVFSFKSPVTRDEFLVFSDDLVVRAEFQDHFSMAASRIVFKKRPRWKCQDCPSHRDAAIVNIFPRCCAATQSIEDGIPVIRSRVPFTSPVCAADECMSRYADVACELLSKFLLANPFGHADEYVKQRRSAFALQRGQKCNGCGISAEDLKNWHCLSACGRCHAVYYCGHVCQVSHDLVCQLCCYIA